MRRSKKLRGKGNMRLLVRRFITCALDDFSSGKAKLEVAVVKVIQTDAIPVLEKLHKVMLILLPSTEERALKQQQRQEMLIDGFCNSGITRSCCNRKPVCYTFENFDKAIKEAIQPTTYNFDPVSDAPVPGSYNWWKLD
ncbi:hypothetical protein RHMOL_Rhmol02G0166500 [Rhododendron molle]|uniref:Uncharacterized protein n=1 Tax=Rhododendron molle TaxID=49168 RepID=A0ACC0PSJ4_RHOML|nr:hypothetical protein RHMOL_Rhmol02G0166500 [Rhododendron molle]